jgi:hypothetical protein
MSDLVDQFVLNSKLKIYQGTYERLKFKFHHPQSHKLLQKEQQIQYLITVIFLHL